MEPVRTCVGCRRRGEIQSLLRVVRRGNEILLDRERVAPGRGAWIHPHQSCVEAAVKHKGFNRAFRVSGGLKTSQLEALVTEEKNRLNG